MSFFRTRVTGDARTAIDEDELRRGCGVLFDPTTHIEVFSVLHGGRGAVGNIVKAEPDAIVEAARNLPAGMGTYFLINPVAPLASGRPKIGDITRRHWFLIDVDPRKAEDHKQDSASDPERYDAKDVALLVMAWLTQQDWPLPVILDSGNGTQLLYRIDLPNDNMARALIAAATKKIATHFADLPAIIDASTAKANQGAKLPGTWARKGAHSDDRPHRMARVIEIPKTIEVVSAERIAALTGKEAKCAETTPRTPDSNGHASRLVVRTTDDRCVAYAEKALENECTILRNTSQLREVRLARAAFVVGQVLHLGLLRNRAEADLEMAAWQCGLKDDPNCGERHIRDTITRQLDAGAAQPREMPSDSRFEPHKNGKEPPREQVEVNGPYTFRASTVVPRKVEWLWPGRIPLGKLTTFAGVGGLGKTFVLCDMTARISTGSMWPFCGGECATAGKVLFVTGEDDPDDTLVPRLIEMGADLEQISFMRTEVQDRFLLSDIPTLEKCLEEIGDDVSLVAIDPPTAFLGGVDDHKNSELRGVLSPLKSWAQQRRLACIFNTHFNKAGGAKVEAMTRVMGSVAWVNAVRAAHAFCRDPEEPDQCVFVPMKMNLAKRAKGLTYTITQTASGLAKVEWLAEVDTTADEAINHVKRKHRTIGAAEWIEKVFGERSQMPSKEIWDKTKAETRISDNALKEAKDEMGIKARQEADPDGERLWYWFWPTESRETWRRSNVAKRIENESEDQEN